MRYPRKKRPHGKVQNNDRSIREAVAEASEELNEARQDPAWDDEPLDAPAAPAEKTVTVVGAAFAHSAKSYWFSPGVYDDLKKGEAVIVNTARGQEMAHIVVTAHTVRESDLPSPLREVVRRASPDDITRAERNRELEKNAAAVFKEKAKAHKLEMHLVTVEYTFDNSKLLFYFTAESRVDFRDLVKDLASVFKTRIELVQIGIRDEAKMIGGLGACGRPFCCSTFLGDFAQVSIKMAKEQNFSLNSTKISGTCGRLMCCLRYEHEAYENALKTTPANGTSVKTPDGVGVVIESRPLAQQVRVRLNGDNKDAPKYYACEDLTVYAKDGSVISQPAVKQAAAPSDNGAAEEMNEPPRTEKNAAPKPADGDGRGNRPADKQGAKQPKNRPDGKRPNRHHHRPHHSNNRPPKTQA